MNAGLQEAHANLHALSLYLLETATRATLGGSPAITVQTASFVSMAQTTFKAVLALESVLGTQPVSAPPVSTGSATETASSYMSQIMEEIRQRTKEIERQAFEQVKKQLEDQKKAAEPTPQPTPEPPQPTVPG